AADKPLVEAGVALLRQSNTMRVTSDIGTDLTVNLRGSEPMFQVGFADDPGRWDHWPSTMVMCWPEISNGQIVLAPGDILLPFKEYVKSAVTLEVVDGHISSIDGGHDANFLNTFFDDFNDRWGR